MGRYGHFGPPHEYVGATVTTDAGRQLVFGPPKNEAFKIITPRMVRLAVNEPDELETIVGRRDSGARPMMLRLRGNRLDISAQSGPIGTPMRWLNPAAVTDLDGDRHAEIAAVIVPHIGSAPRVYRRQGGAFLEVAALSGSFNHVYRTTELALSTAVPADGKMRLLVPDATRQYLRIMGLDNGRLVETRCCPLSAPISGSLRVISVSAVSVELASRPRAIAFADCPGPA